MVVVAAAGVVILVGVVLMVVVVVVVRVGVVMKTVVVVVAMDVVVVTWLEVEALGVAVGVSVGLVGGAVGVKLAICPVDITPAVGDVGGAPSVVVLAVEMAGSAEVTVGEVWEVVGRTRGVEGGSVSMIDVDV